MSLYSTARGNTWYSKLGLRFLEAIDLSENLVRTTKAIRTVPNGAISLVLAFLAVLPLIGFGSLAWYFDIDSSWVTMEGVRSSVTERLAVIVAVGWVAVVVGFMVQAIPWALTLLPTATEMLGSKFAQFNIAAFQWATWTFIVYDAASDVPRVNAEMLPYWSNFVGAELANAGFWGIVFSFNIKVWGAALGYHILWVLALFGASYFLELITLLCLWAVVGFLWKSVGYWVLKVLAGKKWAAKFNRNGGFDDSSVKGAASGGGRGPAAASVVDEADGLDEDAGLSEEELFAALGGGRRRASGA
jgi:hypothetical protein